MRYYIELMLLDNPEVNINFLWSKVFRQIHFGLVNNQNGEKRSKIGVYFPEYSLEANNLTIGKKIRLFANSDEELISLNIEKWLTRLSDYVHISSIRPAPEKVENYVICNRQRSKSNKENLIRRYIKRHPEEQESEIYKNFSNRYLSLPFIDLESTSNSNQFKLFINQEYVKEPVAGDFSSYGFSSNATLPNF